MEKTKLTMDPEDYNMYVNFGLVCQGRLKDMQQFRDDVRKKYPNLKLIFNTMSPEYLFIVKKSSLTPEQMQLFSKEGKK